MGKVYNKKKEKSPTQMSDAFWKDWDETRMRLLKSGYDLSKIKIVEKPN